MFSVPAENGRQYHANPKGGKMKMTLADWPVLIVSGEFPAGNNEGHRLRELLEALKTIDGCRVITSASYEDALEIFSSRADIGCVVIDWDLAFEKCCEKMPPETLLDHIRKRNSKIPVILLTDHLETENLPSGVLSEINDCLWKTADTIEFIAGRIANWVKSYSKSVLPEFFAKLVKYSERYKYAWHTPGHLGGQGFLRAPAGVAMFKFFGENTFRSDLSISVPELGSLLDHEGAAGDAERDDQTCGHVQKQVHQVGRGQEVGRFDSCKCNQDNDNKDNAVVDQEIL